MTSNLTLASVIFVANLTVSGFFVSLAIALLSLCLGKALDYFVKPEIEWWLARRRCEKELKEQR